MKLALISVLSQRNGREMGDGVNTDRGITTGRRNASGPRAQRRSPQKGSHDGRCGLFTLVAKYEFGPGLYRYDIRK